MTLTTQFLTMLAMIGMGSYFGAALDTYNRFLNRTKRRSWVVFCNDILFWLLQGLAIFYVLFLVNKGELRFYIFVALLCGFAAYQSLLKRGYLRLLEIVIRLIISIYQFLVKTLILLIYKPIRFLVLTVISICLLLGKGLLALVRFISKVLLWLVKALLKFMSWVLLLLWNLLPKNIKIPTKKLYNKIAGLFGKTKNILNNWISKWKNLKK